VFCMGCGAETPPNADRCPVCGRELPGASGGAVSAASADHAAPFFGPASVPLAGPRALPSMSAPPSVPLTAGPPPTPSGPAATPAAPSGPAASPPSSPPVSVAAPSIGAGELDAPGLPRDPTGRALLITVLAMMLDLLAPWLNQFGVRMAPAQAGAPALLAVVVLGASLAPLARPGWRRRPAAAVLPVVVGGMALGIALALWIALAIIAAQFQQSVPAGVEAPTFSPYPVADFGLYLFIFGSGVLIYTGYQLFLAAAAASAPSAGGVLAQGAATRGGITVPQGDDGDGFEMGALGPDSQPLPAAPGDGSMPSAPDHNGTESIAEHLAQSNGFDRPGSNGWNVGGEPPPPGRPSPNGHWRRYGPRR